MKLKSISAATIVALGAACTVPLHAEWSSDPAATLVLSDRDNEQIQPQWAPTSDGGFYVSWFDNADGGYDVYLQRLDASGNELWPHDGVLVADRDVSSTEDYGLSVDADGNAYLAYGNQIPAGFSVTVQKVDATGATQWGDGITVSSGDSHAPHLDVLANGNIAVAWLGDGATAQVLDPDGNEVWAAGGVAVADGAFAPADVHGDPDSNVIVSMGSASFPAPKTLTAQKLAAADGSRLWGDDAVSVEDASDGGLQFGNYPPFVSDGAGGAVFVWYTVGASGEVHAQHVLADGTLAFAQNGVLASADTTRNHFEPAGAYDAASGDIYAVWRETDLQTQGQIGVYAQRIDSTGARQWGDEGIELVALSTTDQTQPNALAVAGGGAIFAWASDDAPNPMPIHAVRFDAGGGEVWATDVSTENAGTGRLTSAWSTDGYAAFAWESSTEMFAGDIHAQNVNLDGTLGVEGPDDTIFQNGFDPAM